VGTRVNGSITLYNFGTESRQEKFTGTISAITLSSTCLFFGATYNIILTKISFPTVWLNMERPSSVLTTDSKLERDFQIYYNTKFLIVFHDPTLIHIRTKWPSMAFFYETVPDYWQIEILFDCEGLELPISAAQNKVSEQVNITVLLHVY